MGINKTALSMEHLQWFGLIVQGFARIEYIIQEILGRMHGVRHNSIVMLTVGLAYSGKRDTMLASLRAFQMPEDHKEKIRWFLGEIHKHNTFRNAIAHAYWKKGTRPNSVKPAYFNTRGGALKILGFDDLEQDYTLAEIEALAKELIATIDAFDAFRTKAGYAPSTGKPSPKDR